MNCVSSRINWPILAIVLTLIPLGNLAAQKPTHQPANQLVLAHYMPWFEAKPASSKWGWHWTMDQCDPDKKRDGHAEIASHYFPLIGPYDSGDRHVIEYHLLTMKLAGIDGVIVDWYGLTNYRNYATLQSNTTRLLETAERLKMKFAICYEDQTIAALVKANRIDPSERVSHAASEIEWLSKYWFKSPSYVLHEGKPLLLSFGQEGLSDSEWSQCLKKSNTTVSYFSQHHKRSAAVGAFDWPIPSDSKNALERFRNEAKKWPFAIPVAFPRFVDFYADAKVGKSYGRIEDDNGQTFRKTLEHAITSNAPFIQLATWNDWGEGTQIEPSIEFGYRDLECIHQLCKQTTQSSTIDDLRLPLALLEQRRLDISTNSKTAQLDEVAALIADGKLAEAKSRLTADR